MRYKCVGSPYCLKTFEFGHALRAHVGSCVEAQKKLKAQASVEKLEHEINVDYSGIHGFHTNPYFPTRHKMDHTEKFQFKDRFRFNGNSNKPEDFNNQSSLRPMLKPAETSLMNSVQVKNLLNYQA